MPRSATITVLGASIALAACGEIAGPPGQTGAHRAPGESRFTLAAVATEFVFTGAPQQFIAPMTTEYMVELWGAQGGGSGGAGGYAAGTIALAAGDVLHLYVGGQGAVGHPSATGGAGGWNGGGAGGNRLGINWSSGAGGGGASDVRLGGTSLTDRVMVAGGGGGANGGGVGGGLAGGDGASSWCSLSNCAGAFDQHSSTWWTTGHFSNGGRGGTPSAGGLGGTAASDGGFAGSNGALGHGGRGGDAGNFASAGGGGGGGYYGGGGGAGGGFWSGSVGRGGGGSGHVAAIVAGGTLQSGMRAGAGLARVSYLPAAVEVAMTLGGGAINLRSQGVVAVTVASTPDFDATTIDVSTVGLGPALAPAAHERGHPEDADGDGDTDLVLHFRTQLLGVGCGDTTISLVGATVDGARVVGTSAIHVRGC